MTDWIFNRDTISCFRFVRCAFDAHTGMAQSVLHAVPGVLSVAQVGNELRVLCAQSVTAEDAAGVLQAALQAQGISADVQAITPNLEDVFVSATHGCAKARAA